MRVTEHDRRTDLHSSYSSFVGCNLTNNHPVDKGETLFEGERAALFTPFASPFRGYQAYQFNRKMNTHLMNVEVSDNIKDIQIFIDRTGLMGKGFHVMKDSAFDESEENHVVGTISVKILLVQESETV